MLDDRKATERLLSESAGLGERELHLARRLLILVGAAYLLAQLALFSLHRAASWDEAVYLSQVTPGARAVFFAPSRARGIVLLVAPILQTGASLVGVRLFLAAASAVALTAAFWTWVPVVGLVAPLAGFVFAFSWLGLFYGSEVMPNLWAAILGVAVVGVLARHLSGHGGRWSVTLASVLLGLTALFRPLDSVAVVGPIAVYLLVCRRDLLGLLAPLGAGLVLGWVPWLVEMSVRYGGPAGAFRAAGAVGHLTPGGIRERLLQHLALTDGPTIGPEAHPRIPLGGVLWWGGTAALAGVALVRTRRTRVFGPVLLAAVAGSALALTYLLFVSGLAPRFLLPAYALLSLPAAAGLASLRSGRIRTRIAGVVAVGLLVIWVGWQVGTAGRIGAEAARAREPLLDVGLAIRSLAGGHPCAFASSDGFPEIQLASGCGGRQLRGLDEESIGALERLGGRGDRVFVVLGAPPPQGLLGGSASAARVPGEGGGTWFIYELPAGPASS